jgi:outer membrane protein assembly factor BamB
MLVEEDLLRTIPAVQQQDNQTRVARIAVSVLSVATVCVALLLVERSGAPGTVERGSTTGFVTTTVTNDSNTQAANSGDPRREPWWDQPIELRDMPEIWTYPNPVTAREDGCYITTTRTGEDKPGAMPTGVTPPSTTPALEKPVGTIERGEPCGPGSMRWRYRTGDVVSSSAAFYDGAAVIGSRDGTLYALDLLDGHKRWANEGHGGIDVIPHVEETTVYFGTKQGHLLAADVRDGATLWRIKNDSNGIFQSSPTTHEELLISGGGGNRVRAWKKTTGEKVWEYNTDLWVQSSAAVRNGVVYIGSDDGWLHAVDARNGELKWRFAATLPEDPNIRPVVTGDPKITPDGHRSNVLSTPRFYKNMVFITSIRGVVYGINADTGEAVWQHVGERAVTDTTISEDGVVYVHTDAAILRAYDATTGRVLWAAKTGTNKNAWNGPYQTGSAAVVYGEEVIIGGRDGDITAYDRRTGRYLWSFRTGLWIQSTPKILGDVLVVGSNDGWVYAINLA